MKKKNKYRPKLNLRPQQGNPAPESAIDRSIMRLERLLKVHDAEVDKLLSGEVEKHRWLVSPSMVLRIQREIDALLRQKAEEEREPESAEAKPKPRSTPGFDLQAFMRQPAFPIIEEGGAAKAATEDRRAG